jgi:hypothetical protein
MAIDPKFQPFLNALGGLLSRAAEGAAESVLDEVQGKVREIDDRITTARKRSNAKRKASASRRSRDNEDDVIDVEVTPAKH